MRCSGWSSRGHLRHPPHVRAIAVVIVLAGLVVGLLAIGQQLFDFYLWQSEGISELGRRNATFNDPNITARFLVIAVAAAFALAFGADRWPERLPWAALILFGSAVLVGRL